MGIATYFHAILVPQKLWNWRKFILEFVNHSSSNDVFANPYSGCYFHLKF